MTINKNLVALIEQSQLDKNEALVFCFAVEYLGNSSIDWLIDKGVVTEDNEHLFRINLLNKDYEENKFVLREPLFSAERSGDYGEFVKRLNNQYGFTSNGHPNNQMDYAVMSDDKFTRMSFDKLVDGIADFDLERLLRATVRYYEKTEKCRGLGKYLAENANYDYQSYGEGPSRII